MKKRSFFFIAIVFAAGIIGCNDHKGRSTSHQTTTDNTIPAISLSVIKAYPHDTSSFTQGLVIYKGQLYEGTGGDVDSPVSSKNSHLFKINLQTGKAEKELALDEHFFGEGITIFNDTIYQLTWTERKVFAYTVSDFKKIKEFDINTEGWGITHNDKELIVTDGTGNLYFYEPGTFRLLHTQSVTYNGELAYNLNELEYIDGFIYANVWQQPYILKIDPNNGLIAGRIDISAIWERANGKEPNNVPNGIAYDADTKKIYITGKKWPELYEVQLGQ
ncbi:MAG: glutaminyl-peptide cyclotransferase [Niabella sp.]